MCDDNSPVIDYYPVKFDTDLNGKKQDWEAVVLIPFIEEVRLHSVLCVVMCVCVCGGGGGVQFSAPPLT